MAKKSKAKKKSGKKKKAAPASKKKKTLKSKAKKVTKKAAAKKAAPKRKAAPRKPKPGSDGRAGAGTRACTGAVLDPADGVPAGAAVRVFRSTLPWSAFGPALPRLCGANSIAIIPVVGRTWPPIRGRRDRPFRSVEEVRYAGDL